MKVDELEKKYLKFNENKIKNRQTKIFSLLKRPDACFYYRILTPQQQLARQYGWQCRYNTIDPLPHQLQAGIPTTIDEGNVDVSLKNLIDCHQENLEWADIVIMQRPTCDHHLELMRYIQNKLKRPVVFEADDNYLDVPKHNPGHKYFEPRSQYIKDMISECDLLTVTTEGLADIYRSLRRGKPIVVCPNSINFETLDNMPTEMTEFEVKENRKWFMAMRQMRLGVDDTEEYKSYIAGQIAQDFQRKRIQFTPETMQSLYNEKRDVRFVIPDQIYADETDGKVLIGWGGSPTHREDLAVITNPLMKIMKENSDWNLGMVGFIHNDWLNMMDRKQLWQFGLVPVKYYYSLYKQVGMTIGLAPVCKDRFNFGKSNLKVIEYMSLGVYAIASDYESYKGCGPDVPLCKTEDEWERAIIEACNDDAMRFEITQKNRLFVEDNYNIASNVKYWKDAYESLI